MHFRTENGFGTTFQLGLQIIRRYSLQRSDQGRILCFMPATDFVSHRSQFCSASPLHFCLSKTIKLHSTAIITLFLDPPTIVQVWRSMQNPVFCVELKMDPKAHSCARCTTFWRANIVGSEKERVSCFRGFQIDSNFDLFPKLKFSERYYALLPYTKNVLERALNTILRYNDCFEF